jgi:hypothetical protein
MVQAQLAKARVRAGVRVVEGAKAVETDLVQVRLAIAFVPIAARESRIEQEFPVILCSARSAVHKW